MPEVEIRDYERGEVVGTISDSGIYTDDATLKAVLGDLLVEDDAIPVLDPGDEAGTYAEILVEPEDPGYALAVVDELPSPFDIADLDQRDSLPGYFSGREEGEERESKALGKGIEHLSKEIAESAVLRLSEESEKEGVSSGTAGVGQATYGGAGHERPPEEEEEEDEFEKVDEAFMKFYQDVVWWGLGDDDPDLSKAPNMWEDSENVPEFVKEFIQRALDDDAFWRGQFSNLPQGAWIRLQDIFKENMTQPQGWSLGSMVDDLTDEFPDLDKNSALDIVRTETAAIANKARSEAYEEREDSDEYEFYWSGPQEHRTTPICTWLKEQTHPKFGGTPVTGMDELINLFEQAADEHPDFKGVTPERYDEFVPHYNCRHTFVREVYL